MEAVGKIIKIVQVVKELRDLQQNISSQKRRWWVRPSNQVRKTEGFYEKAFGLMRTKDPEYFTRTVRMKPEVFDTLLSIVKPHLEKFSIRKPINPECRLFLTLMYLGHGMSHFALSRLFRIGESTAREITQEVTRVIWKVMSGTYLPMLSEAAWKENSNEFFERWNFPNCCGAVDGKHVAIQCPPNAGSLFYNYKKQHSIVLMAICDADYNYMAVDIGAYGGNSDSSVFASSEFGKLLLSGKLGLPPPTNLPNSRGVSWVSKVTVHCYVILTQGIGQFNHSIKYGHGSKDGNYLFQKKSA